MRWLRQLIVAASLIVAAGVIWVTNDLLTERFTERTRSQAELRLALYTGNLVSELRRNAIVPQILARDATLIGALNSSDYTRSSQRLIEFDAEIGAASILLLDRDGRVVAATDRNRLGELQRPEGYFVEALRGLDTVFSVARGSELGTQFVYSRRIESQGQIIGVIAVLVNLQKFERSWAGISDAVLVSDSAGQIILATEPRWRGLTEETALARQSAPSAVERALQATGGWTITQADTYLQGEAVMRSEARVPFQGWRIVSFTTYASIRERVNGVLALEIMGFTLLIAIGFYLRNRRATSRLLMFQRESVELRRLNERLQREIAEREKVEKTLEVAEQSLAQSSKLAALGEMSAAISHELNQPLAAMKTYLAGARLLLQRKRPEEALSSFQRIDDLIERMGAITRQLKSFARKGGQGLVPLDLRETVSSALSMMEPQLRTRQMQVTQAMPREPVMVLGDRLRIEQVIINLLRNAVDATKTAEAPAIDLLLSVGDTATLAVRDNGEGIDDLSALFEPFYTTKEPGDGVGLGLAISSGFVTEMGGRLTARNAAQGGAVFSMQLPLITDDLAVAV